MKKMIGSLAACALVATGCLSERDVAGTYNEDLQEFELEDRYGNIQATDGQLQGDIGAMRKMDEDATVDGYDEGDYTTVEVVAENEEGAAMHWLEVYGGVNHPQLRPGTTLTFRGNDYPTNPDALYIGALNCAGKAPYEWDTDEPASDVTVTVEEGPEEGTRQINYETIVTSGSTFGGQQDVSSGSFVLRD